MSGRDLGRTVGNSTSLADLNAALLARQLVLSSILRYRGLEPWTWPGARSPAHGRTGLHTLIIGPEPQYRLHGRGARVGRFGRRRRPPAPPGAPGSRPAH